MATNRKIKNRIANKIPRAAYCTGCGHTFEKMHELRHHRISVQCGGVWLPADKRAEIDAMRVEREAIARKLRKENANA